MLPRLFAVALITGTAFPVDLRKKRKDGKKDLHCHKAVKRIGRKRICIL